MYYDHFTIYKLINTATRGVNLLTARRRGVHVQVHLESPLVYVCVYMYSISSTQFGLEYHISLLSFTSHPPCSSFLIDPLLPGLDRR